MSVEHSLFRKLVLIMETLRGKNGCPWDKEQTHESIRPYCIEEAYEVVEAIDQADFKSLCDELGDLLLQVVFHAQLASEQQKFNIDDVLKAITEKLIRRHPHVFLENKPEGFDTADDVKEQWTKIKKHEGRQHVLDGIPRALPALLKATRMGEKLSHVGFDWKTPDQVKTKVLEELSELESAISPTDKEEEFGDLLFTLCQWARHSDIDAEVALTRSNTKFEKRIRWIESKLKNIGSSFQSKSSEELETLWRQSKIACDLGSLS